MNYDNLIKEHEDEEKKFQEKLENYIKTAEEEQKSLEEIVKSKDTENYQAHNMLMEEEFMDEPNYYDSLFYSNIDDIGKIQKEEEKMYESIDWKATCFEYGYEGGVSTDDTDLSGHSKRWDDIYIPQFDESDMMDIEIEDKYYQNIDDEINPNQIIEEDYTNDYIDMMIEEYEDPDKHLIEEFKDSYEELIGESDLSEKIKEKEKLLNSPKNKCNSDDLIEELFEGLKEDEDEKFREKLRETALYFYQFYGSYYEPNHHHHQ